MPKHKKAAKKPARKVKLAKPMKMPVSLVIKVLQEAKVPFEVLWHKKAAWTSDEIAKERKRPVASIVKCLVLTDGTDYVVACLPGNMRVDTPKVREVLGTGKLEFAHEKMLKKLTGMAPGTSSPIGMKTELPVIVDKGLAKRAKVSISGGNPKFGLELSGKDLVKLSKAKVAAISKK
jgi:Cys-tRNA(Pro) deacylase